MGRIRTIKPEFFTHEDLSSLPEITHLFAAGLLCYADDEGYFNANEKLLQAAIFPLRESSVSTHCMLTQLSNVGYLRLGRNGTERHYGQIVNFDKHQRVNRPTISKIKDLHIEWDDSLRTHTQLTEDSLPEGKGKEGNREGKGREPRPVNEDCGSELMAANYILEELGVVADNGVRRVAADAIRLLAKEGGTVLTASEYILDAGRVAVASGEVINRFWFTDQKYRPVQPTKTRRQREKEAARKEFMEATID